MTTRRSLLAVISSLAANAVLAQGYYVDEQSALRLGDAFSGGAASASDASTAYYNPAAMLTMGSELAINASAISLQSELDGGATIAGTNTAISGDKAETDEFDILPTIYYVDQLRENFAFGAFVNAPYATGTDFGRDSVARYQNVEGEITGIDAGVSFAFKASEMIDLGFSVIAQHVNAKTSQALNTAAICEASADTTTAQCTALGVPLSTIANQERDGLFTMEGKSTAFAFNFGALIHYSENSRLGLNYRTRVVHNLSGEAELEFPDTVNTFTSAAGLQSTTAQGKARLITPESANLSYYHDLGRLSLQADVAWTKWSRFDELAVTSNNDAINALTEDATQYRWRPNFRYAIGANYELNDELTLRTGFALDKTPIRDQYTKVDFAFDDYQALSFGLTYALMDDLKLDAGIQHTFEQKRDINQVDQGVALSGEVSTKVTSYAVGLRWAL